MDSVANHSLCEPSGCFFVFMHPDACASRHSPATRGFPLTAVFFGKAIRTQLHFEGDFK